MSVLYKTYIDNHRVRLNLYSYKIIYHFCIKSINFTFSLIAGTEKKKRIRLLPISHCFKNV